MIEIHNTSEIERARAAGRLAAQILEELGKTVTVGVSTGALNDYGLALATAAGATMAPYRYKANPQDPPFPKHLCTSINQVVCHGIPKDDEYLKNGDIINIDITVILNGFHGDTSRTFIVGNAKPYAINLVKATEQAMYAGIAAMQPGNCISEVGRAIEKNIQSHGYGIVEDLTGHGVGKKFHQEPTVFHFYNPRYRLKLKSGMILTCEPMINQGTKAVQLLDDGWTIVTKDNKLSAQFEHTLLITESGNEILTKL